jgi:hypothetical protein
MRALAVARASAVHHRGKVKQISKERHTKQANIGKEIYLQRT